MTFDAIRVNPCGKDHCRAESPGDGATRGVSSGGEKCYFPCLYQYIGPYKSTKYFSGNSALLPSAGESAEEAARYASMRHLFQLITKVRSTSIIIIAP